MPTVQLLQASVDETEESHFRFLVNGKSVKYVTIAGGLFACEDLCFPPTLLSLLPEFPDGNWNEGYIDQPENAGAPRFVRTVKRQLPAVASDWHAVSIEHLDLSFDQKLRTGIYEATSARFSSPVVAKFARFEWEIAALDHECMAYSWIDGQGLAPNFLGFLTEDGRTHGFIMERITGARHATQEDHLLCKETLSKLHKLGILHGDINKHNFLIKDDRAVLIDFECARFSKEEAAFQDEMNRLWDELGDTSGRGGSVIDP
ncbi:hypothetical protein C1H76_6710 [Elsinoe australis]|uniref:Uncharacterized protein n=1 Tax=Elsinoe australis TaxID=40998 RepID=A0A4U7AT09_9PEZI|nr:hypothetical protein C1H76_6710 [Elsinoe australis]